MKRSRVIMLLLLATVGALVAIPAAAWLTTQNAMHPQHKDVGEPPADAQEVTLDGASGAQIASWYLPPDLRSPTCPSGVSCRHPDSPGVVILHGISSSREFMRSRIALYREAGFAVLAIDHRGQGESTGSCTLGELESQDAIMAVHWLAAQPHVAGDRIAVDGSSFGGMVALVAGAADPSIAAVVAESPAMSAQNFAGGGWMGDLGLWLHGIDGSTLNSVKAASTLNGRPVMVVVGEQESPSTARAIADASGGELWIAPGGHTQAPDVAPDQYAQRVVGFVSNAVN